MTSMAPKDEASSLAAPSGQPCPAGPASGRRYLCLHLPCLPTDRITRRERADPARQGAAAPPFALVAKVKGALRLSAVDARAASLSLGPGQALADARALHPTLRVAEADPQADAHLIAAVADWARRYTPLAAIDGADGVALDITGCAHLFGGEARLMADALERLRRQGFTAPRAGLADTPEAAWALARFAPEARRLCPPGLQEAWLRPLPVAALGLPPDTVAGLRLAGLGRIEDLWLRPRGPIAARFGRQVASRLEAAFGLGRSAISPRLEAPPYVAERRFFDPILTLEDVERTIARLTTEMAALLQKHGDGARRLEVMLFRVDGVSFRIAAGASRPTRAADAMAALFDERLKLGVDERDVAFGFDVVRLSVMEAARLDEAAPALDRRQGEEDLARLVDRLGARLGEGAVRRIALADAHLPEQAAIDSPVGHEEGPRRSTAIWNPTRAEDEPADRPILLFARPEPIETLASLPDGPPVRFRWRRVLHEVAAVEGPERLSPPWWETPHGIEQGLQSGVRASVKASVKASLQASLQARQQAATRDYFRAEDRQGRRFWIYREGLYESRAVEEPPPASAEAAHAPSPPRWFVHGLFG